MLSVPGTDFKTVFCKFGLACVAGRLVGFSVRERAAKAAKTSSEAARGLEGRKETNQAPRSRTLTPAKHLAMRAIPQSRTLPQLSR